MNSEPHQGQNMSTAQRYLLTSRDRAHPAFAFVSRLIATVAALALGIGLLGAGYWIGALFLFAGVFNVCTIGPLVQLRRQQAVARSQTVQTVAPAGWYPDANAPGFERWWDGQQWTQQTRQTDGPIPSASNPRRAS